MKLECIGFVNFQPENIRQGIYGLVTIVLKRAWAALKCDQLPVDFSKGLKNEFERAVVNEPSVFEPLKFYCKYFSDENIFLYLNNCDLHC